MRVKIEPRDDCVSDGICAEECPDVFTMDDDGLASVINGEPDESLREAVLTAAEECPVDIIIVED